MAVRGRFAQLIFKWRWNSVIAPIYAIWMMIWGLILIINSSEYTNSPVYSELFTFIPPGLWGAVNLVAGLLVLHKDSIHRILIQSVVVVTEGVTLVIASLVEPELPAFLGARVLVVGWALWTLAIRMVVGNSPNMKRG